MFVLWLPNVAMGASAYVTTSDSPYGSTDPDSATLVLVVTSPSMAITDPDSAILATVVNDPSMAITDPDSAWIAIP